MDLNKETRRKKNKGGKALLITRLNITVRVIEFPPQEGRRLSFFKRHFHFIPHTSGGKRSSFDFFLFVVLHVKNYKPSSPSSTRHVELHNGFSFGSISFPFFSFSSSPFSFFLSTFGVRVKVEKLLVL